MCCCNYGGKVPIPSVILGCYFYSEFNLYDLVIYPAGQKLREIFQLKRPSYADLPAAKISEMMHSNSLDVTSLLPPRIFPKFVEFLYLVMSLS